MKLLTLFLLLATIVCNAQDTNDITRKVFERDRDKNGKPDFRMESVFRGGKKALVVWSKPNAHAVWAVTSRAYYANGDMISLESDEDEDGLLETLVVYRSGTEDIEVFTRRADGSVSPVNARTLAAYKKQHAAVAELWDNAFDKDMDADKFIDRMQKAQRKIRAAEKGKEK